MSDTWTQQGLTALKTGDKEQARQLFSKALSQDKQDVQAWLGLSLVIDDQRKQRMCLQRVLEMEPDNRYAKKWLARLESEFHEEVVSQQKESTSETDRSPKRFSFESVKQRLFGNPQLPLLPILLVILLLTTEMFLMLIGQYTGYWHNFATGNVGSNGIATVLNLALRISPFLFVLLMLGYAFIIGALLRFLAYAPALILWMVIFTMHLQSVIRWLRCSLWQSFQMSAGSCSTVAVTSLIVIAVLMGMALAMVLWPRGTAVVDLRAQKQPKVSSWMYATGGIWVVVLLAWLAYRVLTPIEGWVPIAFENGPPPRASAGIAYDTDRQTAVIFGGASEYIGPEWNDWKPINDTWEWDGENWLQRLPSTSPPARCCSSLFFDSQRGKVILTSGLQTPDNFLADVWEWDGNNWLYIDTRATVPRATAYALAYHEKQNQTIAFFLNETWVWDSISWNYKSQTIAPPARSDSAMAYDPSREQIILYGGCSKDNSGCVYGDTWVYDGEEWREIILPQNPPSLSRHLLFYDQKRERIMLYGGYQQGSAQALLWELNLPDE